MNIKNKIEILKYIIKNNGICEKIKDKECAKCYFNINIYNCKIHNLIKKNNNVDYYFKIKLKVTKELLKFEYLERHLT